MSGVRRSGSRRVLRALTVVATALGLALSAACTTIPTDGRVHSSSLTVGAPQDQFIRVLARPPRVGASPEEVLRGFLAASASFDDGHAVARRFLTETASEDWEPTARVAIYDSAQGYQVTEIGGPTDLRVLALRDAGSLTARGVFSQPRQAQLRADFGLVEVDGEWRIDSLPQGLVLGTSDVARAYRTLNLYFPDFSGGILVPTAVALPAQTPGLATRLVRELLRGPTDWIAPSVSSAFPRGTELDVDAVPIEDGIASVDLDEQVLAATGDERRALAAQLTFTLAQLADVTGVRIKVRGVPLTVPGVGAVTQVSDWPGFNPNTAPLDKTLYALDSSGRLSAVTDVAHPVAGYFGSAALQLAAVSLDGAQYAGAVVQGGDEVVRLADAQAETAGDVLRTPGRISSLSFDWLGTLWATSVGAPTSGVWTTRSATPPRLIPVGGLGRGSVESVRVARDGARAALIVRQPSGTRVLRLARVVRDGTAVRLEGLRALESGFVEALDVAWADDSTLLVIARSEAESAQTYLVGTDGNSTTPHGSVPQLGAVAAAPGSPSVASGGSQLWANRGNGWRRLVAATAPIYPG